MGNILLNLIWVSPYLDQLLQAYTLVCWVSSGKRMQVLALPLLMWWVLYTENHMCYFGNQNFIIIFLLCVSINYIACFLCRASTKCIIFVLRGCMMHPYLRERCVAIVNLLGGKYGVSFFISHKSKILPVLDCSHIWHTLLLKALLKLKSQSPKV